MTAIIGIFLTIAIIHLMDIKSILKDIRHNTRDKKKEEEDKYPWR